MRPRRPGCHTSHVHSCCVLVEPCPGLVVKRDVRQVRTGDIDLGEVAVAEAWKHGGDVYLAGEPDELNGASLAAVLRY